MNSSLQPKKILPAILLAGLVLGGSTQVLAQDATAPAPTRGEFGPGGPHGMHGGGPFMHELKQLNLSDSQRETIKGYVKTFRENARSSFASLRSLRHAFDTTAPNSASYSSVVAQLATAEASAAPARIQAEAALRAQVFSVLTDEQKSQLTSLLASLPEPPAPMD